ncbi:MAG TPA: chorismate pyruvate-lyase family protein [Rhizomicrobium sp.]|nr:chorismate pyruvate-lyase family protein [Rhizomicrobium sp.]
MSAIELLEHIPGIDVAKLAPLQRILLVTDGTLTEILEACLLEPIELVKLSETLLKGREVSAPTGIERDERVLERKINLRGAKSGVRHVYAESLILVDRLDSSFQKELLESNIPLGRLWRSHRLETFKQLVSVACRPARELGAHLGCAENAPVLGRIYDVFSAGRPVMRIAENFCAGTACVPAQSTTMR